MRCISNSHPFYFMGRRLAVNIEKVILGRVLKNAKMLGPRNPFVGAIHELPLQDVLRNDKGPANQPIGRGNPARRGTDGRFSAPCKRFNEWLSCRESWPGEARSPCQSGTVFLSRGSCGSDFRGWRRLLSCFPARQRRRNNGRRFA
jgi:hypothetical protein